MSDCNLRPDGMKPGLALHAGLIAALAVLAGCGKSASPPAQPAPTAVYGGAPPYAQNAASTAASTPAAGTQTLEYPDELQMLLLAYRLAGQTPPLEDWAGRVQAVRMADEFARPALLKSEVERLTAIAAATANIGFLKLKTDCNLSEYDATRGGFYVRAFEPGIGYDFEANGEKVALLLTNAAEAYLWPLTPEAAQEVLHKAGTHAVDIDMRIAIGRAQRRAGGLQIDGRVLDYQLLSRQSGAPAVLGGVTLK